MGKKPNPLSVCLQVRRALVHVTVWGTHHQQDKWVCIFASCRVVLLVIVKSTWCAFYTVMCFTFILSARCGCMRDEGTNQRLHKATLLKTLQVKKKNQSEVLSPSCTSAYIILQLYIGDVLRTLWVKSWKIQDGTLKVQTSLLCSSLLQLSLNPSQILWVKKSSFQMPLHNDWVIILNNCKIPCVSFLGWFTIRIKPAGCSAMDTHGAFILQYVLAVGSLDLISALTLKLNLSLSCKMS